MRLQLIKPVVRWTTLALCVFALSACLTPRQVNPAPAKSAPTMKILSPASGAVLQGPKVKIEVEVSDWKLVDANQAAKEGEGHLHFFVNKTANAINVGEGIPLDQKAAFVHAGKAPYTSREIELASGEHTITVVMGNSVHQVLDIPAPVSVTFKVQ